MMRNMTSGATAEEKKSQGLAAFKLAFDHAVAAMKTG
jgi:hypothetical protein